MKTNFLENIKRYTVLSFILLLGNTVVTFAQSSTFKHRATASNIVNNYTVIDHARTNNQGNKVLFITHDFRSGPYVQAPLGVFFSLQLKKWAIFQQDKTELPENANFNVLVRTTADRGVFVHTAKKSTIGGHITTIDHPAANNNPNAKLMVTQSWVSVYNNNPIGVYYSNGRWRIFNQNFKAMPENARFNVMVNHSQSFVHTASTPAGHMTKLDNAKTNNKANAFVFITPMWTSVYNNHNTGVYYNRGYWSIYNEDVQAMPRNAKFVVIAYTASGNGTRSNNSSSSSSRSSSSSSRSDRSSSSSSGTRSGSNSRTSNLRYKVEILDLYCHSCDDSGSHAEFFGSLSINPIYAIGARSRTFWSASERSAKAESSRSKIAINRGVININQSFTYEFKRADVVNRRAGLEVLGTLTEHDGSSANDRFRILENNRIELRTGSGEIKYYYQSDRGEQIWVRYRVTRL